MGLKDTHRQARDDEMHWNALHKESNHAVGRNGCKVEYEMYRVGVLKEGERCEERKKKRVFFVANRVKVRKRIHFLIVS